LLDDKPDVVVDVVDASNLERNLYLAVQMLELGVPLVLALNMSDIAKARGVVFDLPRLSELLGAPIVPTVGHRGEGLDDLLDAILQVADSEEVRPPTHVHYGQEIEREVREIGSLLRKRDHDLEGCPTRLLALRLLENDPALLKTIRDDEVHEAVAHSHARIERVLGAPPEIVAAEKRYGYISGACQETVCSTIETRHSVSDNIDTVLAHRILGLPIFLVMMYVVFQLTFELGAYPVTWLEWLFGRLASAVSHLWPTGADSALQSLLVDGIIGGVGGVMVFLPNIMLLFLAIAILEGSGYMARAAFVMDHLMRRFGLPGKSFVPMLIGFGCSVPAILATRTLDDERDRLTTMLVAPLMSCGARLPIYALFIPAFFPHRWQAPMLWLIYLIGIVVALASAKLLRATLLRGEETPFVMELPPYRMPTVQSVLLQMWRRSWLYLRKAGTVILAISIVLWALTSYPKKTAYSNDYDALEQEATRRFYDGLEKTAEVAASGPEAAALILEALRVELHANVVGKSPEGAVAPLLDKPGGEELVAFLDARAVLEQDDGEVPARVILDHDAREYQAAAYYLEGVKGPFDAALVEIEQARGAEDLAYTVAGRIGHGLEPMLKPMGFDWRIGTALIGAFAAKEVFVAQLGIVFSVGEGRAGSEALREHLREAYTPLVAFCIMLFCLISAPCVATIAVTKSESNSWRWPLFQLTALTCVAWVLTTLVFQVGRLLGAMA